LQNVEALMHPEKSIGDLVLGAPRPGDYGWVVSCHGSLYASEYGWNEQFEGLVAKIVANYLEKHDPAGEHCWIARVHEKPSGCVFLVRKNRSTAQLRLLLVEPGARGHGVGRQLVAACIAFARKAGYRKIQLWTNSVLDAARHIYEKAGFVLVESEKHHSFGQDLVGQTWELMLKNKVGAGS
jgi:GNAT superfamily N-acetyltransferase